MPRTSSGTPINFLLEFVVARESEHALGQGRAPLCALCGIFKKRDGFGIIGQPLTQKFETAKHRHQQVIEIVGDAAGELTDRLQLLRLHSKLTRPFQILFGFFTFGYVAGDLGKANNGTAVVPNSVDHDMRPEPRSVLADTPSFPFNRPSRRDRLKHLARNRPLRGPRRCRSAKSAAQ